MKKRGQFELSFGMIFSIILIAVFLVVAFYAIKTFLSVGCDVGAGGFIKDLQGEVDRIWASAGEEEEYTGKITGSCDVEYVCFFNENKPQSGGYRTEYNDIQGLAELDKNIYITPVRSAKVSAAKINHLNMEAFTENPHCIKIENGEVTFKLSKGLRESLVTIQ